MVVDFITKRAIATTTEGRGMGMVLSLFSAEFVIETADGNNGLKCKLKTPFWEILLAKKSLQTRENQFWVLVADSSSPVAAKRGFKCSKCFRQRHAPLVAVVWLSV